MPEIQQVTFYLGYDDKYVYLAMHSPHKEGTYPSAAHWEYRFAYLPYSSVAECSVDLDFFGVPPEITAARSFRGEAMMQGLPNVLYGSTYMTGLGMDYLDHMSLDEFRALACTKSMQLPTTPWFAGGSDKSLPAEYRMKRHEPRLLALGKETP